MFRYQTKMLAGAAIALAALLGPGGGVALATPVFTISVQTANMNGVPFDALPTTTLTGAISASFTYAGALNFNNPAPQNSTSTGDLNQNFFVGADIMGYSGSGTLSAPANANFTSLSTFLASSGSAANFQYGSLYQINLGVLVAGEILTITHDDGISVFQGSTQIGNTVSGPTTAITEHVTITTTGDTMLYYARENGTPSILEVSANGQIGVPEPDSMLLLGTALLGLGLMLRQRRRAP